MDFFGPEFMKKQWTCRVHRVTDRQGGQEIVKYIVTEEDTAQDTVKTLDIFPTLEQAVETIQNRFSWASIEWLLEHFVDYAQYIQ